MDDNTKLSDLTPEQQLKALSDHMKKLGYEVIEIPNGVNIVPVKKE